MDYKPGDVANGHVLGNDNVWHPVASAGNSYAAASQREGYGQRYKRRWPKTALVLACLTALSTINRAMQPGANYGGAALLIDLVMAMAIGALVNGSLVNLVVAAFPSRKAVR